MSIIFESTIKSSGKNSSDWYIELKYLENNIIKNSKSVEEYEKHLNELCSEEGIMIESNEIKWAQDSSVSSEQYAEINSQMRKYQEELKNDSNDR